MDSSSRHITAQTTSKLSKYLKGWFEGTYSPVSTSHTFESELLSIKTLCTYAGPTWTFKKSNSWRMVIYKEMIKLGNVEPGQDGEAFSNEWILSHTTSSLKYLIKFNTYVESHRVLHNAYNWQRLFDINWHLSNTLKPTEESQLGFFFTKTTKLTWKK